MRRAEHKSSENKNVRIEPPFSNENIDDNTDMLHSVALKPSNKPNKDLIDYVMTAIIEFGRRHKLPIREASNYLNRFKGIDFLTEFYDIEHTLSFNDCVDDLTIICQNNGGKLR